MQYNKDAVTIEGVVRDAIVAAGGISESNADAFQKVGWSRAARTDKGVSAVGQVVAHGTHRLGGRVCLRQQSQKRRRFWVGALNEPRNAKLLAARLHQIPASPCNYRDFPSGILPDPKSQPIPHMKPLGLGLGGTVAGHGGHQVSLGEDTVHIEDQQPDLAA